MSGTLAASARAVTESELRGMLGQVAANPGPHGSRLLLVASAPIWNGPPVLETDLGAVRVVAGPSPLAVRIALIDHPEEFLAVLTHLGLDQLGDEVAARAWRHSLRRPSPWDAVTSLFKVTQLDPSLRDESWMVELLVRLAPPGGYPQPISGLLDRDTAWRTLLRHALGMPSGTLSPGALLEWLAQPDSREALAKTDAASRKHISGRLALEAEASSELLVDLAAAGRGTDLVPLGLVIDALWPTPDPAVRVRFEERHLGGRPLSDPAAADWSAAALEVLLRDAEGHFDDAVSQAESILVDLDPGGSADSALLPSGFVRRLDRFGQQLQTALDVNDVNSLRAAEAALDQLRQHRRAAASKNRLQAAEAAVRLLRRRLARAASLLPETGDLTTLTRQYLADGAWVDAARHRIAEGDSVGSVAEGYRRLLVEIDDARRQRDRSYAQRVAEEAAAAAPTPALDSARPLRIEDVLGTVLAPLAAIRPVLLLVIDGLSHAALPPLLDGLLEAGCQTHVPTGRPVPAVIAALPTVTKVSRASLLSGIVASGTQEVERAGFASNGALLAVTGGKPPVLFHKADLRSQDGEIAPAPREAIADASQRVVGVVVNAADDHLAKGDQLRLADGLDGIPVMRPLLDEALQAGRIVVLTSDHGHILGSKQRVVASSGGGERYRIDDGTAPADDEVRLVGSRVVGGPLIAGADDGVRYISSAKHGYHGGASPAEVLCPLLVLTARDVELEGWESGPVETPSWWDPASAPVIVEPVDVTRPRAVAASAPSTPQPSLLDELETAARQGGAPDWIDQLLASPRLADQQRLTGRARLDDQDLATLLSVLVAAGGTASGVTLQRTLRLSASRLRGKLEAARSLLNVEGYAVLRIEADGTTALNLDLLAQQFEIARPAAAGGGPT